MERYKEQKREEQLIIERVREEKLKQEKNLLTVEEKSRIKERVMLLFYYSFSSNFMFLFPGLFTIYQYCNYLLQQ